MPTHARPFEDIGMTVISMEQERDMSRWACLRCAAWVVAGAIFLRLGNVALAAAHFFTARAKAAHDRAEKGICR